MKFIQKYLVVWFFVCWIGYIALRFIFSDAPWKDPDLFNAIILGFIMTILLSGAISGGLYFSIIPKMKYIESRDLKVPLFDGRLERIIKPETDDFSFAELQRKINQNWILTYVDNELNILKFRTKDSIFQWGVGSYLAYDDSDNTISVVSFPFTGNTRKSKRLKTELNNRIEELILSV